jgi:hypothetical protein
MSFYKGKRGDKYCGLCGGKVKTVKCYSGIFSTKSGKKDIDTLVICGNDGCYGKAPDDLMLVKGK